VNASPLVCRLDALDAAARRRHAQLRLELMSQIRDVEELPDGWELEFPADADSIRKVSEWMSLERLCCPFLSFGLSFRGDSDGATLRLTGPEGAKELLRSELFGGSPPEAPWEIGTMRPEELPQLAALLKENRLPLAGLEDHLEAAIVARKDGDVVGSAILEIYGREALLRSVAVDSRLRGRGLGIRLAEGALALARQRGVERVFLLTETAAQFFPKLGFRVIYRSDVPQSVRQSAEFQGACPASAVAMEKSIASEVT
jgi:amino-acid N-acetyltransferase